VPLTATGDPDYPWQGSLALAGAAAKIELVRTDK
jgi:hypothetical protein